MKTIRTLLPFCLLISILSLIAGINLHDPLVTYLDATEESMIESCAPVTAKPDSTVVTMDTTIIIAKPKKKKRVSTPIPVPDKELKYSEINTDSSYHWEATVFERAEPNTDTIDFRRMMIEAFLYSKNQYRRDIIRYQ